MDGEKSKREIAAFFFDAMRRALFALNAFLALVAVFAAALFFARVSSEKMRLPQWVCNALVDEAKSAGVGLSVSSISLSLDGSAELINAAVKFGDSPFPVFTAGKVNLEFGLFELAGGKVYLKSVSVEGGRLSDGLGNIENSPRVRGITLDARQEGAWWIVDFLGFRSENLSVSARGILNLKVFSKKFLSAEGADGSVGAKMGLSSKFDAAMAEFSRYVEYFKIFKEPSLNLDFSVYGDSFNRAEAAFHAAGCSFSVLGRDADAEDINIVLEYFSEENSGVPMRLTASARHLRGDDMPSCENVSVYADIEFGKAGVSLQNAEFLAEKIEWKGFCVDNVSLKKDRITESDYFGDWMVFAAFGENRMGGKFSYGGDGNFNVSFGANMNPRRILGLKILSDIPELEHFDFPNGLSVRGTLSGGGGVKSLNAKMSVEAENCVVMDIPVERVSGNVEFDASTGNLLASEISVRSKQGWGVCGEMLQNIENLKYIIRVNGTIRPMAIAHFMEPWWTRVMGSFSFEGENNFPCADMYVEGRWGEPEKMWCFGTASGKDALYNGARFDMFDLRVWVNPSRITLYDISINSAERQAHAFIEWLYPEEGITRFKTQRIFMESNLNSAELSALGGTDAQEVLDVVRFHNAPRVTLNALLQNPYWKNGKTDEFNVQVFAKGRTSIEMASLNNLSFDARSNKIDTNIDRASFDFCGGQADARIDLKKVEGGMLFSGTAKADGMVQSEFIEFLDSLDEDGVPISEQLQATSPGADELGRAGAGAVVKDNADTAASSLMGDNSEKGVVNIEASLCGDSRKFSDIRGRGKVELINEDLLELNIFGMLSRALSAVKLPFGSFDLTKFTGVFSIGSGEVEFPKLEITGPVMLVSGSAAYNFMLDNLRATLTASPFEGVQTPIISNIVSVINPIANVATIRLSGKLADPKYGVSINPLKIFRKNASVPRGEKDARTGEAPEAEGAGGTQGKGADDPSVGKQVP